MQPHARQFVVAVSDHVSNRVEGVVQLNQQPLRTSIVKSIHGHQVYVVEGKVLKLGVDEIVLLGVTWHNVSQVKAVMHHGGPIEAETQEAQEEDNHNNFALGFEEEGGIFFPGKNGQVPVQERERDTLFP